VYAARQTKPAEAVRLLLEALRSLCVRRLRLDPDDHSARSELAEAYEYLGDLALREKDLRRAQHWFDQCRVLRERRSKEWQALAQEPLLLDVQGLCALYERLGRVALAQDDASTAYDWFEACRRCCEEHLPSSDGAMPRLELELAGTYKQLSLLALGQGNAPLARAHLTRLDRVTKDLLDSHPLLVPAQNARADALSVLAGTLEDDDPAAAERLMAENLAIASRLAEADPHNHWLQQNLAISALSAARAQVASGNGIAATELAEQALTAFRAALAADPAHVNYQDGIALAYSLHADAAALRGDREGAYRFLEEERTHLEEFGDSADAVLLLSLSGCYDSLGEMAMQDGRVDDASGWYERALRISRLLVARDPTSRRHWDDLAMSCRSLAELAHTRGDHVGVRAWLLEYAAAHERLVELNPEDPEAQSELARVRAHLAATGGGSAS
jgi:tetratricopeptide (TPR) repeat protein